MKSFKSFITESAQQGFVYENNAAKALKLYGIVPQSFTPAGAGSDIPDLLIKKPDSPKTAGCELKITAASAGSLVLKYDLGKWTIGNPDETNEEKLFIMDLAQEVGIIDQINRTWDSVPTKGAGNKLSAAYIQYLKNLSSAKVQEELDKMAPNILVLVVGAKIPIASELAQKELDKRDYGSLSKREMYKRDLSLFKDIKGVIPASKIEDYYNKKKTYYINVGTHGFYLLGSKNPLNLAGLPRFGSSASAKYRARVQYKGKDNYQFTFEMQFSIPADKKSPYNIAPTIGKTVNINKDKMEQTVKDLFGVKI
jgi:hypothetical protein